jgi:hypothetical protein
MDSGFHGRIRPLFGFRDLQLDPIGLRGASSLGHHLRSDLDPNPDADTLIYSLLIIF